MMKSVILLVSGGWSNIEQQDQRRDLAMRPRFVALKQECDSALMKMRRGHCREGRIFEGPQQGLHSVAIPDLC